MVRRRDGLTAAPDEVDRQRRRRQGTVVGGLFLTLGGLYAVLLVLPADPGTLAHALPILAVGLLGLWVGGILLGVGRGRGRH